MMDIGNWYVVHTYSGYENKVKANLEKSVENRGLQEFIQEVRVPVVESLEEKNGKKHAVQRKLYPGYVMVKMVMTDESWYVVRNTRGVTGFVGSGTKPIPLTQAEVENMGVNRVAPKFNMVPGDHVRVTSGPLETFVGVIATVDMEHEKVRVNVSMFGRDTPVELEFGQITKL